MKAVLVIDAQNEFSEKGKRAVPDHKLVIQNIKEKIEQARSLGYAIAWVKHFNLTSESPAFIPGSWGAEIVPELLPVFESHREKIFEKNVYGAFTGTAIGEWLAFLNIRSVIIMGFYTHGCVSTTAREAIMKGLDVFIYPDTTATCALSNELLGNFSASEIHKAALLELNNMGVHICSGSLPL